MNCAIGKNGKICWFVRDCVRTGRDFAGSNMTLRGVKTELFEIVWTDDAAEGDRERGYDRGMAGLAPAMTFAGVPVGSEADVDGVTRDRIAEAYSPAEELRIIRRAVALLFEAFGDRVAWPGEFTAYHTRVEGLVAEGHAAQAALKEAKGALPPMEVQLK